jgi:hypothetical protein
MTTSVDRADPDGTAITTADPVTTMASVTVVGTAITADPVTTAAAAAEEAATAKPLPAQVTAAAPRLSPLCVISGVGVT